MVMISRFNSNTDMPVPSNVTRDGSFWDLNLKNTEDDMTLEYDLQRCVIGKQQVIHRLRRTSSWTVENWHSNATRRGRSADGEFVSQMEENRCRTVLFAM